MRRLAWIVGIGLALALGVGWLWSRSGERDDAPSADSPAVADGPRERSPSASDDEGDRLAERAPERAPSNAAAPGLAPPTDWTATAHDGQLEVKVTAAGKPVEGVRVRLYWRGGADPNTNEVDWRLAGAAVTRADGVSRIPARPGPYLAVARAEGFAPAQTDLIRPLGEATTRIELKLDRGFTLNGRTVARGRGEPVPLADVTLIPELRRGGLLRSAEAPVEERPVTTSDPRGSFRLTALAPGAYQIEARAVGHARTTQRISVPSAADVVLELSVAGVLEGFVVDAAGRPAAGAVVSVVGAEEPVVVSTGSGGGFSAEVERGTYEISARRGREAGSLPKRVTVAPGSTVRGLTIQLGEGGTIEGTVVASASGDAVAGAQVAVSPYLKSGDSGRARTAEDGSFTVEGLPPGSYDVVATAPGYSELLRRGITVGAGQRFKLVLSLAGTGSIEGVVTDEAGRPVAGALVRGGNRAGSELGTDPVEARTDAEGSYVLSDLALGRTRISAQREDGYVANAQVVEVREGESTRLDFTLARGGVLAGRVITKGGASTERISVMAQNQRGAGTAFATAQADGAFRIDLVPGSYRVIAFGGERRMSAGHQTVTIEAGKTTQVELSITDEVEGLAGVVLEPDGSPSAGASVMITSGQGRGWDVADSEGRFVLRVFGEPTASVTVRARNGNRAGELQGVRADDRTARVRLQPPASLRGRAIDSAGRPVSGFALRLNTGDPYFFGGAEEGREFTGDRYTLIEVPSGKIKLSVRTAEGASGLAEITLAPGDARELDIRVDAPGAQGAR